MAFDEALADRVRNVLSGAEGIVEKRMFGGIAFLLNGNMCCGVHGDELILRLDREQAEEALRDTNVRVFDLTGRPMKGWLLIAPGGVARNKDLRSWVGRPDPMSLVGNRGLNLRSSHHASGCTTQKGATMGQPVVHFEVIGKDGEKLQRYYSGLFGWEINADNPMNYGMVPREGNVSAEGVGIGGGVGAGPNGYGGHVTFYVEVPDVEAALAKAESLGGSRVMGPEKIMDQVELGHFKDPEGHLIGVVKTLG